MNTSKDARVNTEDRVAEEIAEAAQLAALAFSGVNLPDDELDLLCEAVVSHNAECSTRAEIRNGLSATDSTVAASTFPNSTAKR